MYRYGITKLFAYYRKGMERQNNHLQQLAGAARMGYHASVREFTAYMKPVIPEPEMNIDRLNELGRNKRWPQTKR